MIAVVHECNMEVTPTYMKMYGVRHKRICY